MVKLDQARVANRELVKRTPLVAVFSGATTGIGEYTVRALCKTHGSKGQGLRIYIVGRNESAAQKVIDDCSHLCAVAEFHFVKVEDLTLLKDVDRGCEEVIRLERGHAYTSDDKTRTPKIDILIMSQGKVNFGDRKDTREGLDQSMALLYYSRIRFVTNLMPLLLASTFDTGARVVSVFAGGMENVGKFYPDDLSLRQKGHYSFSSCRTNVIYMKTLAFEHLAKQHTGKLSLVHVYPGLVFTPAFYGSGYPWWFRILRTLFGPLAKALLAISPDDIGDKMVYLCSWRFPASGREFDKQQISMTIAKATDGTVGGGAYSAKHDGEINDTEKYYIALRRQGFEQKAWNHTMEAFEVIEAGECFKD